MRINLKNICNKLLKKLYTFFLLFLVSFISSQIYVADDVEITIVGGAKMYIISDSTSSKELISQVAVDVIHDNNIKSTHFSGEALKSNIEESELISELKKEFEEQSKKKPSYLFSEDTTSAEICSNITEKIRAVIVVSSNTKFVVNDFNRIIHPIFSKETFKSNFQLVSDLYSLHLNFYHSVRPPPPIS